MSNSSFNVRLIQVEDNTNRPLGLSLGVPLNRGEQRLKWNMKFKFKCYIFKMASCHLFILMNGEIMVVMWQLTSGHEKTKGQVSLFGFSYLTFSFENVYLWWVQFSPIIHIKTPKNVNKGEGMFHVIVFKSRCFTRSHKKPKAILFWSRCHERFSSVLVWIISKNAPKSIGRLFQRGLTQIAVLRKQWASIILNKRLILLNQCPSSIGFWPSWNFSQK